jgi:hypothetical protein
MGIKLGKISYWVLGIGYWVLVFCIWNLVFQKYCQSMDSE